MKKILLFLSLIALKADLFAMPIPFENFYLDGFGGVNAVNNIDLKVSPNHDTHIELGHGFVAGGAVGYRFLQYFRSEIEVAYRQNDFQLLAIDRYNVPAEGDIKKVTLMGNGYYSFPLFAEFVTPYLGIGIGSYWDKSKFGLHPIETNEGTLVFETIHSSLSGLSYQGIIGFIFAVGQKMHSSVEYRYLDGRRTQGNHSFALNMKYSF